MGGNKGDEPPKELICFSFFYLFIFFSFKNFFLMIKKEINNFFFFFFFAFCLFVLLPFPIQTHFL